MEELGKIVEEDDIEEFKKYLNKTDVKEIINKIQNDFLFTKLLIGNSYDCALELLHHLQKFMSDQNQSQILRALRRRNASSLGPSDVLGNKYMADPTFQPVRLILHSLLFDFLIHENFTYTGKNRDFSLLAYFLQTSNLHVASFILELFIKESTITIHDLLDLYHVKSLACNHDFMKDTIQNLLEQYSKQNRKLFEENLLDIAQYMNKLATQEQEEDSLMFQHHWGSRTEGSLEETILLEWAKKPNMLFMTKVLAGDVFSKELAEILCHNYFQTVKTIQSKPQPNLKIQTDLIPLILRCATPVAVAQLGRTCTFFRKLIFGEQSQQYWKECMEYYLPGSTHHEPRVWWLRCLRLLKQNTQSPFGLLYPDSITCDLIHFKNEDAKEITLKCDFGKPQNTADLTITGLYFELKVGDEVTIGSWKYGTGSTSHALIFIPDQKYKDVVRRDRNSRPTTYTQDIYRGWILKQHDKYWLELYGWWSTPVKFTFTQPSDANDIDKLLLSNEYSQVTVPTTDTSVDFTRDRSTTSSERKKCVIS